jgi:hypothetical protein
MDVAAHPTNASPAHVCSCGHPDDAPAQVCVHLRDDRGADYVRWYHGVGRNYILLCLSCAKQPEQAALGTLCAACFAALERDGSWEGVLGAPQFAERPNSLRFEHTVVALPADLSGAILDLQPIEQPGRASWLVLTSGGRLHELDLAAGTARPLASLPPGRVDLAEQVTLHLAPDARFVAVVNRFGRFGHVLDLVGQVAPLALDRGDYHEHVCVFPLAFVRHQGRTLLIHATDWNRLDVSDPATGAMLTTRGPTVSTRGQTRPEHELNPLRAERLAGRALGGRQRLGLAPVGRGAQLER